MSTGLITAARESYVFIKSVLSVRITIVSKYPDDNGVVMESRVDSAPHWSAFVGKWNPFQASILLRHRSLLCDNETNFFSRLPLVSFSRADR